MRGFPFSRWCTDVHHKSVLQVCNTSESSLLYYKRTFYLTRMQHFLRGFRFRWGASQICPFKHNPKPSSILLVSADFIVISSSFPKFRVCVVFRSAEADASQICPLQHIYWILASSIRTFYCCIKWCNMGLLRPIYTRLVSRRTRLKSFPWGNLCRRLYL